jgi:hypothetical protein
MLQSFATLAMPARLVNGRRFTSGRLRIRARLAIVIVQSVAACWKEL